MYETQFYALLTSTKFVTALKIVPNFFVKYYQQKYYAELFDGKLNNMRSATFVLFNPSIINPLVINFTEYTVEVLESLISAPDFNEFEWKSAIPFSLFWFYTFTIACWCEMFTYWETTIFCARIFSLDNVLPICVKCLIHSVIW